ncbi:dTDP-4-dehydrorhamnose reductase [Vibrio coralliilyticus]|uniref:dTDP-4-dehydrorhamnose reductase n=1 Tax=Vibrio coralliilyticus TaxID=190893 RepID=UPI000BAC29C0|nr:dTDP-4-dehydrorhamnose reductase [Vibrio coralliilyticus]NOI77888.1 dTDP-4-dehydrorhamnose reductase [Vibrio coralliilyticus]PAW02152.1 dTDP-4-dehydrorhamnose reductase [Vibrio coralliilyticus]
MKILITGCQGQVGDCLVQRLNKRNDVEVIAYDREELDITNSEQVSSTIARMKPNVIVNAAAHTAVDKAETDVEQSYAINHEGPLFLAKAAKEADALLLHISTDYVFDGAKLTPYSETDATGPQGVYGKSKLAGEQAVEEHCSRYAILRTAWVFGEHGNNFVKTMLRLGIDKPELGIIGDQFGGPTYAGDIADVLIIMMDKFSESNSDLSGVYHFSGAPHVSWYEFACEIFSQAMVHDVLKNAPKVNKITADQYPLPAPRPENSRLDCSKIESVFGVTPSDWKLALTNIAEYK